LRYRQLKSQHCARLACLVVPLAFTYDERFDQSTLSASGDTPKSQLMSATVLSNPSPSASAEEIPFFFTHGSAQLFALLHKPRTAIKRTAFVVSHAFAEEKLWSHRVTVNFARALAERGYPVLRFDYRGAGDSSGMTQDTSLQTHLDDLRAAVSELERCVPEIERIGLIGLRLGASFAALLAEQAADDQHCARLQGAPLVLWEPAVDGDAYFQELLRSNVATQMAVYGGVRESREVLIERIRRGGSVNVDGYEIGKALLDSTGRNDLLPGTPKLHAGPVLVVQLAASEQQKTREELQKLATAYTSGTFVRAAEQPFWREIKPFYSSARNLQKATLDWLEQCNV
jgi:exosortase A-associated hydrolase 2